MTNKSNVEYARPWAGEETACQYLEKTPSEVARMVADLELFACPFSDAITYFPVRQFVDHAAVDGLAEVLRFLNSGISSPQVWATRFAGPSPGEHQTIWDALGHGRIAEVLIGAEHDAARWAGRI